MAHSARQMNASVYRVNMKERQRDAPLPGAAPPGQRESLDKSPHYTFQPPRREGGMEAPEPAGGPRERLARWADEGRARLSPPGAYRVTGPGCPRPRMEAAPHARWGVGETEAERRRSYPVRGPCTAAAAFSPSHRSSFTPHTASAAAWYPGGERVRDGRVYQQDGGWRCSPGMHTFRPVPHHDHQHDARRDARRGGSREPPLVGDNTPPDSLHPRDDTRGGCRTTFLTEAVTCSSRLSDSPDPRRTSQTEAVPCEADDLKDVVLWDYKMWREGRSPSCSSNNTIYANTSDPGAPEPTYENVFECLLRESSVPPAPSSSAAPRGWAEEPIYATLGEQLLDGECVTDFRQEQSCPRIHPMDPRVAAAAPASSGGTCPSEDEASDSSATGSGDEFSPSASTLTLRPGGESHASGAGGHDTVEQDTAKDLPIESDQPDATAAAPHTPPPTLPPKLLRKKPPGLKLHIPGAAPPTDNYGLQVRLPLMGERSTPSPLHPVASTGHEGEAASQEAEDAAPRQGSLYVVVGSASPGEPCCCCSTNTSPCTNVLGRLTNMFRLHPAHYCDVHVWYLTNTPPAWCLTNSPAWCLTNTSARCLTNTSRSTAPLWCLSHRFCSWSLRPSATLSPPPRLAFICWWHPSFPRPVMPRQQHRFSSRVTQRSGRVTWRCGRSSNCLYCLMISNEICIKYLMINMSAAVYILIKEQIVTLQVYKRS